MNKNFLKIFLLSVAVLVTVVGPLFAPTVSAATDPNKYIDIPLNFSRNRPTTKPSPGNCEASTPNASTDKCIDIVSGTGMYQYVRNDPTPVKANIGGSTQRILVVDTKTNTNSFTTNFTVLSSGVLRIYGPSDTSSFKLGDTYRFDFSYVDTASSDIQQIVNNMPKYCTLTTPSFSELAKLDQSSNEWAISRNLVNGCGRYSSEPFLPSVIGVTIPAQDAANNAIKYTSLKTTVDPYTVGNETNAGTGDVGGSASGDKTADQCAVKDVTLRWIACPITTALSEVAATLSRLLADELIVPTDQIFGENATADAYFKAWSVFRIIAIALILIAGLIMVISQAAGMELFDAYTIRKLLPRLVVAVIGISLSWPILKFLVILFNDLGMWADALITAPFQSILDKNGLNVTDVAVNYLGAAGVVWWATAAAGSFGIIMSFLGTIAVMLLIGFFVLIIRQIVIVLVLLIAPLAIAAYILPGTQKLWHFWRETLTTSLMMFPIIMAFIAVGKVMSATLGLRDTPNPLAATATNLVALIVYFAPYALLPFAFKLAGGLMSTIFSISNDRSRGVFDRLKKDRQARIGQHNELIGRRVLQERADMNAKLQKAGSSGNFIKRRAFRGASRMVGGYNIEAQMSARRAAVQKELNDQIATGADDEIRGLTARKVGDKWVSLAGKEIDEAAVMRGRQRWGKDSFAQQAALSYEMRKASSEEELQSVATNYPMIAKSWGMNDNEATSAWIGSAFENQNSHLEYKNMRIQNNRMRMDHKGYNSFVDEVYNKKGSYSMAQMGSNTIEELKNGFRSAGDTIANGRVWDGKSGGYRAATTEEISQARDMQEKIQGISETFMHSYGARNPDGEVIDTAAAGGGSRQANTPGAAHVAERVRELATLTGTYTASPSGYYTQPNHEPTPNRREQS